MTIRPAREMDFPWIKALLAENGFIEDGIRCEEFSPLCLVAERDGELVGAMQMILAKPAASLSFVAVARHYQHRGYGIRLLQAMELLLREYGVHAWTAGVSEKTQDVLDIMERIGARNTGRGYAFIRSLAW